MTTCSWFDNLLNDLAAIHLPPIVLEQNPDSTPIKADSYPPLSLDWCETALHLGHIEPSQPKVKLGWPLRPFFKNSLYIDLICWQRKYRPNMCLESRTQFYSVCDLIFVSSGDKYEFPPLEECQNKFNTIKERIKYEHP